MRCLVLIQTVLQSVATTFARGRLQLDSVHMQNKGFVSLKRCFRALTGAQRILPWDFAQPGSECENPKASKSHVHLRPLVCDHSWSLMINPAARRCASEVVTCICRAATRSLASETFWLSSVFEVSDAVAVALASLPKGGNGEKIEERMVLACRSWTCKGKMSGGGWWRDCFTSNQYTYILYISYISISLKGYFPMLSRSDPPHAARLKQRQARDGTKIVNTEGAKRQDVRSCAKSCNSSVREACDASASWSLASIVDFASWPQFPQDQSLPAKPCKAYKGFARLASDSLRRTSNTCMESSIRLTAMSHAAHAAFPAPSGPLLLSWMFGMSSRHPPKCWVWNSAEISAKYVFQCRINPHQTIYNLRSQCYPDSPTTSCTGLPCHIVYSVKPSSLPNL